MSIASLFKPVDSSKTRLPRTDVLERVAKYADGKSVVSNYFDISTEELINMLRSDLVPAPEVEYVTNIVRGRLSGEVGEAPKKSVGEAIKTTPIKEFTVSDPTKDFITPESVRDIVKGFIDASSAPTGFKRGNYLESLIGSGTTGGPTQRGTPAKGVASADSVDFERGKYLESLIGSGTSGGPTQRGSPAKGKSVDPRIFTTRPIDPYIESGQTAGMDYNPRVPTESVDPRIFTTRPTDPYVEPRQTGGMSYTPQTPTESVDPRVFTSRPADPYVESRQTAGMSYTPTVSAESATSESEIAKILQEKFNRERAATNGFFSNELNPLAATDQKATSSAMSPPISENFAANMAKRDEAGGFGISDTFKKKGIAGVAKDVGGKAAVVGKDLYEALSRPVVTDRQEMLTEGKPFETPTSIALGEEGVQQLRKDYYDRERRKAVDPTGIAALSSDVGAATDQSGGIVPRGVDPTGIGRDSTPTPAFVAGTDPTRVTSAPSAPSAPSASSATPTTDYRAAPDKPTKDDKKAIQETATEVAKNPSVGGIQSLFEQAGFSDALLQLGLGMMASKNPSFLGALGESGQSAVALMAKQREEAKKAKLEADKAALEERRVKVLEAGEDRQKDADKSPAAMKSAKYLADATIIAQKQKAAGQFGTPEQLYVMGQTRADIASQAEKAGQQASSSWQSGLNKILTMDSDSKRAKEAKAAALAEYYKNFGENSDEAYNKGISRSLKSLDPQGLLSIGIAPVQNTVKQYDPTTGTLN